MATASHAISSQGDRGIVVASLLVLLSGAAAGFGRVFAGRGPTARLVGAAVASVLLAALLRRRHLLLSVLASAVSLAIALGLLVFPSTTLAGIPTGPTISAIVRSLGRLGEHAAREVAPAPPLTSLMTASILAVWTAGAAAHALAARSRSAVLPILPPAALLAFAGVVTEQGPAPMATITALVGALGVLFGVGLGRITLWGPVVPWGERRRLLGGTTVRWAGRLGLVAVAAALVLPGLLPGYRSSALLTFEPGPAGRVAISPIVDIRPSLLQNPTADLFYVRADRRAYWRMLSLDQFTGEVWTSSNLAGRNGIVLSGPTRLPDDGLPGEELEQEVRIAGLAVPWLPAAFQPVVVEHAAGPGSPVLRHDADNGMLVRDRPTERDDRYTVVSRITVPTARQLDRSYGDATVDPLSTQFAPYLALPEGLPAQIGEIARRLTAEEPTPFRKLLAIQSHLRSFTYDETAPPGHGSNHIVNFLTETRTGFCEQFSGTFAVLARSLGYPARVAVGFLPGTLDEFGQFRVTTAEAHAWPEVFFPGYGWIAFEPTPTRSNPVARQYLTPTAGLGGPRFSGAREAGAAPEDIPEGRRQREAFESPRKRGALGDDPTVGGGAERENRWLLRVLALVAALSAASIALAIWKLAVRRVAAARAGSPREGVMAAYRAFLGSAADVGMARRPGETPGEFRTRLRADVRLSNGHLDRLTTLAGLALYSNSELTGADVREAADAGREAAGDLHRHVGVVRSAAGILRPSWPLA